MPPDADGRLFERRSARVLREGPHQGLYVADHRASTPSATAQLAEDRLFGTIEPDRYYTLYGDAVEQRFEAATTRKLFLKIERRQFAALFGDFETGLNADRARPLQPQPHGPQGRLRRRALRRQRVRGREPRAVRSRRAARRRHVRACISSRARPLVANSDSMRIEVRDRFRSEVVVESRLLTRFVDYSLDYFTGTLTLKSAGHEPRCGVQSRSTSSPSTKCSTRERRWHDGRRAHDGAARRRQARARSDADRRRRDRRRHAACRHGSALPAARRRSSCAPRWRKRRRTIRCARPARRRISPKSSTSRSDSTCERTCASRTQASASASSCAPRPARARSASTLAPRSRSSGPRAAKHSSRPTSRPAPTASSHRPKRAARPMTRRRAWA